MYSSKLRHLAKAVTYRAMGTVLTILLAWVITGNPVIGLKIGFLEVLCKLALYYFHERVWYKINFGLAERSSRKIKNAPSKSAFIVPQNFYVDKEARQKLLNQKGKVIWFCGLSGAGKTTLADGLERELNKLGFKTFILDGDNLRSGLCKDLGFSEEDREENIRRASEVAKLTMESGIIVLCAFVTPFNKDREAARKLIGEGNLVSVFVDCPLDECEKRDVKGLYKKAREGLIKNFTGISSPFEIPTVADLTLKTAEFSKQELIDALVTFVKPKIEA
ncbi:MAG: adenylyl-sulfate kinase [Sphingobacteriales bacterium]